MEAPHLLQIDLLKGLAIISVIITHSLPVCGLIQGFTNFYVWQAVPIFIILMGLNSGMSFTRRGYQALKPSTLKPYFISRFWRIVFPFVLLSALLVIVGIFIFAFTGKNILYMGHLLGPLLITGILPISGPGNYFITFLFQFIFVFPLIYYCYKRNPALTIIACFAINLVYELGAPYVVGYLGGYYYEAAIFKYLSAIALGLWISDDLGLLSKRNRFVLFGAVISITYLFISDVAAFPYAAGSYSSVVPYFLPAYFTNNLISYFYPALLILIGIKYLPATTKNRATRVLAYCGKLSYHIFLVQIVYFTFIGYLLSTGIKNMQASVLGSFALMNIIACLVCGVIFYHIEHRAKNIIKKIRWDQTGI